ncbi:FadD3 family acyl-CoA ligase [Actinoplanes couchii]|uniref:Acyl-CoA synthetase n=1 Tax=Actinoplanes couchii TaxID=403638 RepID=A0ABQ3XF66_9ACTN|nr:FadD3 family acyl-CoA ligase [Actinoplanes couchii]MDR6321895.1 acyl-CoA synthetase (AMP-forming)/AMP-acid ligase II [Actinoplanes couchii]GID57147.1 acyl-CoA synthetase [Actinoplanes couchii]
METIPAAVAHAAREFGREPALVDPGVRRFDFAELHDEVRKVAHALIASGIEPGDRVALWAPNSAKWVLAALGVAGAGAVLVPVNMRFTGPEADEILRRSGARGLIVSGPFLGTDRLASLTGTPPFVLSLPDWDSFLERGSTASLPAVRPDDLSDILYTSGTTGRSKGAMSAHRQSLGVARAWAEIGGLSTRDRYLVVNPFFNSFGLKAGLLACLVSGATIVPQAVFDVPRTLDLIELERISVLPGPPTLYLGLLDHPARAVRRLGSLRLAVTGAATVPPVLVDRIRDELGFATVLTAYGLTEAVVATMCRPGDDTRTVAFTCGRAAAGFDVRIAEKDGEVLLRGPNLMLGYLDDPAATAEAIDADGWLHTGDVGELDGDGNLRITDRLKDMYICGGFNVYPAEVERALAALPGVAEVAVVGVPDERLGEVGRAFVVPRPGAELAPDAVIGFCRERLAGYKVPRSVALKGELPHNASGKVLKYLLREESR